ncbi:hypothetical protein HAZT_HAZT006296 [Hyalella azteca]|uniref:Transmembrane protein 230 n=1 Tax=Hyalella azteca TaxID=294128 RepID=A0A6A0H9J4_HYAAZ|nr:transmembrane protein 230-like [Hyalella azteca]KAA0202443.1 hypothetical protein HAZT_HAZT006296 [Hyalella azteca]
MAQRRDGASSRTGYQRLSQDDSGFIDAQFKAPETRIPWKSVWFAIVLLVIGTVLLVVGSLLVTGHIHEQYSDRTWPLLILGALMFIPGSYHSYICYYAFKGYEGFSFENIPSFDD